MENEGNMRQTGKVRKYERKYETVGDKKGKIQDSGQEKREI